MTTRLLLLPLLAFVLVSCDRAADFAHRAASVVRAKMDGPDSGRNGGTPDPALQALVDESPDGFLFRKDLPFPSAIEVKITEQFHYKSARAFHNSALGAQSTSLEGKFRVVSRIRRSGDEVHLTLESVGRTVPDPKDPTKEIVENVRDGLSGSTAQFHRRSGKPWKARATSDFKTAVWSRELEPVLPMFLSEHGATPRPQWFGKRRIRIGDSIPITGEALALLFGTDATGAVTLKFESVGAAGGHPCGIFAISGDYRRRAAPSPDGTIADEDVTIESGKIWLSLIHPIVLCEEFETVQTQVSGAGGGPSSRVQGAIAVSTLREWIPLGPQAR